jgi:hypothetical protein
MPAAGVSWPVQTMAPAQTTTMNMGPVSIHDGMDWATTQSTLKRMMANALN